MTTEPDLIQRVRKLLALADSSNKHEAAAAMRAAQRVMTEHNISKAQLDASDGPEGYHAAGIWQGRMPVWKVDLARAMAHVNGCVLFSQPFTKNQSKDRGSEKFDWFFVGDQQSAGAAAYLFAYVVAQIGYMASLDLAGESGAVRHSYYQGMAAFLIHELVLEQQQSKDEAQGQEGSRTCKGSARRNAALAVIDSNPGKVVEWLRENLNAHCAAPKGTRSVDYEDAFVTGFSRGQLVDMGKKKLGKGLG